MWKKGECGNPGGRPKSQFDAYIREQTMDGKELADKALNIMRTSKDNRIVIDAMHYLADRGWGKPMQAVGALDEQGNLVPYSLSVQIDPNLFGALKNGKSPAH